MKTKNQNWTCSVCEKEYEIYPVILDSNPLSISIELEIREEYYNQELKKGLCERCRKRAEKDYKNEK